MTKTASDPAFINDNTWTAKSTSNCDPSEENGIASFHVLSEVDPISTTSEAFPAAVSKQGTATPQNDDPLGSLQICGSTSAYRVLVGTAPTLLAAATAGTSVVHRLLLPSAYRQDETPSLDSLTSNTLAHPCQASAETEVISMSNNDQILPTAVENDRPNNSPGAASPTDSGASSETTEPPNALAVLYSALPSDVAASVASELNIDTTNFLPATTSSRATSTSRPTSITTATSSALSTFSTITRSTSGPATATATPAPPSDDDNNSSQLRQGSVAGIATGAAAGVVLIILAALLLFRRKRQGKPMFGRLSRSDSNRSVRAYPEVAWLYDPAPTPPRTSRHYRRGESGVSLLPTAYGGAAAAEGAGGIRTVAGAFEPESPLLPPQVSYARDESPGSSGGSSPRSARGPSRSSLGSASRMGPIWEEPGHQQGVHR
ncbi:unnamed protein product [Cercospora beticola]|nr:unnamed protein product [Cercospora beticola]